MKMIAIAALAVMLAGCSAPSGPGLGTTAPADQYFYPPTNGLRYVYTQDDAKTPSVSDTSMYQVVVGTTYDGYAKLVANPDSSSTGAVLYYYKVDESQAGVKCILSTNGSDKGIVALEGNLQVGSSWKADDAGTITATVVGRYADYYLPGRRQVYHDAVAVKYVDATVGDSTYILRIFAREFGLILEQTITNQLTELSNLQLIVRYETTNSPGGPVDRGHWYDFRGKYSVGMNPDDPNIK